ncbi:MAG: DUF1501 domain-containing protein [Actinomycetota bacterium]|nr:DUF1501 domain-containing protein [Actinomycetota bacterium]
MSESLDRRQFFKIGAGAVVVVGLGACTRDSSTGTTASSAVPGSTVDDGVAPVTTPPPTTTAPAATSMLAGRRLVVVQLNGGNDLLNTLPPTDGRYHDLRPTLALPDSDVLALSGVADMGLHPSLAPISRFWDAGRLAVIRGIGFEVPNRSHFVSMDRWWRADELTQPGWLGRVLDSLPGEPPPLFATALGGGAPLLDGREVRATVITSPSSFRWVDIEPAWLAQMGEGGDDLAGLARHALRRTVQAVADFAEITDGDAVADDLPTREGGASITEGLDVAAQMLAADVGTQLVVVSAGGFDTHAGQLPIHADLLADLAGGIDAFFTAVDAAGMADDVLLVVTSEFGRRAAENGSGGCDHGAGGASFAVGAPVRGGVFGEVDLGDLLDGDVRPSVAPHALFTRCLDWLGVDAEQILGRRDDSLDLLRR